nr:hypothetical protein [Tanacetum cinerariifolium]
MYLCFLQLIIRNQVGDLSTHTTKYTSPALTQKVFANIRRVGKGFSGVETPLFEGMLVEQHGDEEGDANEHVEEVNIGDAAEGDDSAAHGEVPTIAAEQSISSPTPTTPPPQPPQDIPSTSQVQQTPPQSPQVQPPLPQPQPQPPQAADFPMSPLQEAIDACAALTRRVEHLKYDKVAQPLEITKLKRRVKKLEKSNKGWMIAEMDQDDDVVLKDDKEEDKEEDKTKLSEVQEVVDVVTIAKLITEVVTAASETVTAASAIITTAEAQVPAATTATLTAAPARVVATPSRRRKGVIINDPEEESATSTIIPAEIKSKDKDIDWDEAIDHVKLKAKEDPAIKRYQAMKRKPQTEAQARKNMMMYLKNTKEQMKEEENRALQTINETPAEKVAKRRKLNEEVEDLKRHLQIVPNEDDDVYTEATPLTRKRVDTSDDTALDDVSNQGRMIADIDADAEVVLEDAKEVADVVKDV